MNAVDNQVNFNGAMTTPVASTLNLLFVTVPPGAVSGDITVNVGGGPVSPEALGFTVVPPRVPPTGTFLNSFALGGNPRNIAILPDGSWAFISTDMGYSVVGAAPTAAFLWDNHECHGSWWLHRGRGPTRQPASAGAGDEPAHSERRRRQSRKHRYLWNHRQFGFATSTTAGDRHSSRWQSGL